MDWKEKLEKRRFVESVSESVAELLTDVDRIDGEDVWVEDCAYDVMTSNLHVLAQEGYKYEMDWYIKHGDSLMVKYTLCNKTCVMFVLKDLEGSLARISNGKCKLVETTTTKTTVSQTIQCEVA